MCGRHNPTTVGNAAQIVANVQTTPQQSLEPTEDMHQPFGTDTIGAVSPGPSTPADKWTMCVGIPQKNLLYMLLIGTCERRQLACNVHKTPG